MKYVMLVQIVICSLLLNISCKSQLNQIHPKQKNLYNRKDSGNVQIKKTKSSKKIKLKKNIKQIKSKDIYPETVKKMENLLDNLPKFLMGSSKTKLTDEEKKALENLKIKKEKFKNFLKEYRKKDNKGKIAAIKANHFFELFLREIQNNKKTSKNSKVTGLKSLKAYDSVEDYLKRIEKLKTKNDLNTTSKAPWDEFVDEKISKQFQRIINIADSIFKKNNDELFINDEDCNLRPVMQKGISVQRELFEAIMDVLKTKPAKENFLKNIQPTPEQNKKGNYTRVAVMIDASVKKLEKIAISPIERAAKELDNNSSIRTATKIRKSFNDYLKEINKYKNVDPQGEALRKLVVAVKEKGKKSLPIFGGMMRIFLYITGLKNNLNGTNQRQTSVSSMVSNDKRWENNFDRIIKYVSFGQGMNLISLPFNKIWYVVKYEKGKKTKKGMRVLLDVARREYSLVKEILKGLRNNKELTIRAFLNKQLVK